MNLQGQNSSFVCCTYFNGKNQIPNKEYMKAKKTTVLIADCDEASCFLYKEILNSLSINSIVTNNGITALQKCDEEKNIKIVLTEIRLNYLDGIQLLHGIRNLRKNIKVALLTASATSLDFEKYKDAGFDAVLTKPVSTKNFILTIKNLKINSKIKQTLTLETQ